MTAVPSPLPVVEDARSRFAPWWLGAVVLVLGSIACALLWWQQHRTMQALAQVRFEQQSQVLAGQVQQSMRSLEDVLRGMGNLFLLKPHLRRSEFEQAVQHLDGAKLPPGVKNLHFTRYVPGPERTAFEAQTRQDPHSDGQLPQNFAIKSPKEQPQYYVVDFIWPLQGNVQAMGLDIQSQPANIEGMLRAQETGKVLASPPFNLHQEKVDPLGLIMRLPLWESGTLRKAVFLGAIGVSVRLHTVFEDLRSQGYMQGVAWKIHDAGWTSADGQATAAATTLLAQGGTAAEDAMQWQTALEVGGRRWVVQTWLQGGFLSETEQSQPWLLALGGWVVSWLVAGQAVWWALVRRREREHACQLQQALQMSERRFAALFNQAAVGVAQTVFAPGQKLVGVGRMTLVNQKFCDLVGYTPQELHNMTVRDINHPEDVLREDALMEQLLAGEIADYQFEKRYIHKNGDLIWVEQTVSLLRVPGDSHSYRLEIVQEIGSRKHMEQALRDSETRLRNILSRIPVGVSLLEQGKIVYSNAPYNRIIGYSTEEIPDMATWWTLLVPDVQQRVQAQQQWQSAYQQDPLSNQSAAALELKIETSQGQERRIELMGQRLGDADLLVLQDLTPRKQAEEEIRRLAYFDPLTGLPNRRLLLDRLRQALALSMRNQQWAAVLMLDLDHFKTINDTQGPEKGDQLLCAVADRLREHLHADATLARLGGDEFVVVLPELGPSAEAAAQAVKDVAQRILVALQEPVQLGDEAYHTSLSIGINVFQGQQGESADELLQRCDIAMYQAKTAGRNTLRFYDPQMQVAVTQRAELEADLRIGLQQEQFVLHFQPQVDCERIVGAEVLLRWQHPRKGSVSPAQFIPLAEASRMILPLGQWVLQQSCQTLARWRKDPRFAQLTLAVNVSPQQFYEPDFVARVLTALQSTGAQPEQLKLELTESLLLQDVEGTIAKMAQLRGYGVRFSLDDFGTGYSSLAYLKQLPLQELKIDQSFVRDVLTDPNDAAIARTIVALAQSLNLQVTAEGVETVEQRILLERFGCHAWQGYLLSPPVPVQVFENLYCNYDPAGNTPRSA